MKIFVTGLPGSGKTTAADILSDHFRLRVANVGDLLAGELTRADISYRSRAEIGITFLRHRPREAILELIAEAAARGISVFDGIRLEATCTAAREHFSDLSIWNIESPVECRLQRLRQRLQAELGSSASIDKALWYYALYDEENVAVSKLADVRLDNDDSIDVLRTRVDRAYAALPDSLRNPARQSAVSCLKKL